ncbi:hypothetical protein T10_2909 [Trichinella papuae]|uniref:Uncharacterized protein n=1 Tax=Trichinella papuae TaxID=268474 RepID=A0A0V1MPL0_9BILA|nr:hypothetical protein T10_2909 [Trichinella papuae]
MIIGLDHHHKQSKQAGYSSSSSISELMKQNISSFSSSFSPCFSSSYRLIGEFPNRSRQQTFQNPLKPFIPVEGKLGYICQKARRIQ